MLVLNLPLPKEYTVYTWACEVTIRGRWLWLLARPERDDGIIILENTNSNGNCLCLQTSTTLYLWWATVTVTAFPLTYVRSVHMYTRGMANIPMAGRMYTNFQFLFQEFKHVHVYGQSPMWPWPLKSLYENALSVWHTHLHDTEKHQQYVLSGAYMLPVHKYRETLTFFWCSWDCHQLRKEFKRTDRLSHWGVGYLPCMYSCQAGRPILGLRGLFRNKFGNNRQRKIPGIMGNNGCGLMHVCIAPWWPAKQSMWFVLNH